MNDDDLKFKRERQGHWIYSAPGTGTAWNDGFKKLLIDRDPHGQ